MARSPTVNWAIVGLGDIVRKRVATAIREQAQSTLYACVTRNPEARRADLESFAPQKVYNDLDRMLADPNVDVVYLATPVWLHAPQTIASLKAGKDVLVEKPMALDARESAEMCAVPCEILNMTGTEKVAVVSIAEKLGELMGNTPKFTGTPKGTSLLGSAEKMVDALWQPPTSLDEGLARLAKSVMAYEHPLDHPTEWEKRDKFGEG